jgi:rubrerythrin
MLAKNEEFPELQKLIRMIENHEERLRRLESHFKQMPEKSSKDTSPREFTMQKQPKSEVEKALVVGYFLEQDRGYTSFNAQDLMDAFREAKEIVPANINLAVIKNVAKGLFMETKEKKNGRKAWTLTNGGLSYVERLPAARQ